MPEVLIDQIEHVAVAELHEHPSNPRQGDVGAIVTSISENGFFAPLLVQRTTDAGESGPVCAGNHRLKAARALKMATVPVCYLEVDDDTALRILLADNRSSDLATNSDADLVALLQALAQTDRGLDGILYDGDDLDELLTALNGPPPAPDQSGELGDQYAVVVMCYSEAEQLELIEELSEQGRKCRALVS